MVAGWWRGGTPKKDRSANTYRTSDTSRLSWVSARRAKLAADDVCLMD